MRDASRVNRGGKPFRYKRAIRGLGANVAINERLEPGAGWKRPARLFHPMKTRTKRPATSTLHLRDGTDEWGQLREVAVWRDSHRSARRDGPRPEDRLASLDQAFSLDDGNDVDDEHVSWI